MLTPWRRKHHERKEGQPYGFVREFGKVLEAYRVSPSSSNEMAMLPPSPMGRVKTVHRRQEEAPGYIRTNHCGPCSIFTRYGFAKKIRIQRKMTGHGKWLRHLLDAKIVFPSLYTLLDLHHACAFPMQVNGSWQANSIYSHVQSYTQKSRRCFINHLLILAYAYLTLLPAPPN